MGRARVWGTENGALVRKPQAGLLRASVRGRVSRARGLDFETMARVKKRPRALETQESWSDVHAHLKLCGRASARSADRLPSPHRSRNPALWGTLAA